MYHIVLSQAVDLVGIDRDAQVDRCPRHVISDLSQRLGATVHQPGSDAVSPFDTLCARIIGRADQWALVRRLAAQLTNDDTVFCLGEDVGFALAILCKVKGKLPKLVVSVIDPERARVYGVLKLFRLDEQIERFITNTQIRVDTLCAYMYLTRDRVHRLPEPIDTHFFRPTAAHAQAAYAQARPTIASISFEQRDYQTLAAATQDLNIEVKISAVSSIVAATQVAFPPVMPANMSASQYDWATLLQLYQTAAVVVVSLPDRHTSAVLTTLLAALACQRPVIVTRTPGLAEELIDLDVVTGVNPGDAMGLQHAITHLLNNPQLAAAQAQAGYDRILSAHTSEVYVDNIINQLQNLDGLPQTGCREMFSATDAPVIG